MPLFNGIFISTVAPDDPFEHINTQIGQNGPDYFVNIYELTKAFSEETICRRNVYPKLNNSLNYFVNFHVVPKLFTKVYE